MICINHTKLACFLPIVVLATTLTMVVMVIDVSAAEVSSPAAFVSAETSAKSVQVAQPFTVDVTVQAAKGSRVTFPEGQTQLGDFDVISFKDRFDVPSDDDANVRTWTRRWTLDSITSGELQIPPLEVQVQAENDAASSQTQRLTTAPITIRVISVLEDRSDPTKFRDIQSVVDVGVPEVESNRPVAWSIGGTLVCLCAGAALALSRRRRWIKPKDWAMDELDQLVTMVDSHSIDCQTYAQKLSQIVRSYLMLELDIDDVGRTPEEWVQQIVQTPSITADDANQLSELFALTDRVRFAGLALPPEVRKSVLNDSRSLVDRIAKQYQNGVESRDHDRFEASDDRLFDGKPSTENR